MKNLLTVVMLFVFSTALYAQKDVTKFLGIPVDGAKTAICLLYTSPSPRD